MHIKVNGLVLGETILGEGNKIINVLTDARGIIGIFVNKGKSSRSKNACATQLFSYSNMVLYKGQKGYIINDSEIINVFSGLGSDIARLALAQYFCEVLICMGPKEESGSQYLRLALNCLSYLEKNKIEMDILKSIFELRMCSMSGYMPNLIGCRNCNSYKPGDMYFCFEDSSLICKNCLNNNSGFVYLPSGVSEALRHIVYSRIEKLFLFKISDNIIKHLSYITEKYMMLNSYTKFKALEFYKSLKY